MDDTMNGDGIFNIDGDPVPLGPPTIHDLPLVEEPASDARQRFEAVRKATAETGFLIHLLEMDARDLHDGHLTLMRFTTGWKGCFGTPDLDTPEAARAWLQDQPSFPTLSELARALYPLP